MKKLKWLILGVLAYSSLFWGVAGIAQAGVEILPVDTATLKQLTAGPSVSIYQLDSNLPTSALSAASPSRCQTTLTSYYRNVTDCWLPEWNPTSGGKSVYIVVNRVTVASISLVTPHAMHAINI